MTDLTGTHAIIVGVANRRSIAWAVARALASRGVRLALTYADHRLAANVEELASQLDRPLVLPCDVTNDRQIAELFTTVEREFGGLDCLLHGAAFALRAELAAPFVETTREGFRAALDVSVYSLIALARGAAPLLAVRGGGSILTLTYLGSERVFPNYNVMGVAKAALEAAVRYLAADLGRYGTRVNAVSAGPIRTLASTGITGFSEILRVYRHRAPLQRNIEASEVADAAVFLLSPASRGITGEVLMVDAGFHAMGI